MHTITRSLTTARRLHAVLVVGALALATAACGSDDTAGPDDTAPSTARVAESSMTDEPIRIGVLAPTTGPQTILGTELVDAMEFFVAQHSEMAGRPVELIVEDTASQPQQGLAKAQKLVESDRVDIVAGVVNSAVLEAVAGYTLEQGVPLVVSTAASDTFTIPDAPPNAYRVGNSAAQNNRVLGWYAYDQLELRNVAILTYDFIAGDEFANAFTDVFAELGGTIVSDQRTGLGTQDYGAFITNVPRDADGLYVFLGGADAIRFWEQARDFGLTDRTKIIGGQPTLDPIVYGAVGAAAEGFVGPFHYLTSVPVDGNEDFVEGYTDAVGNAPTFYAVDAYTTMQAIAAAVEATGGDTSAEVFLDALGAVQFEASPRGEFRFSGNGQAVYTVYLAEAVMADGEPTYRILDEVTDVTQQWTP